VELAFFYLFAALALLGAGLLVFCFRNPVYGAISLIVTLFAVAGLFVLLDAHFLGAIQVLVYAGAIMVLFLFVTMLLNLQDHELGGARRTWAKALGAAAAAAVTGHLCSALLRVDGPIPGFDVTAIPAQTAATIGTVESVGRLIFTRHLLSFEVTSVLILAAIVATVVVAKRRV